MTPAVVGLDPSLTGSGLAWPDGTLRSVGQTGLTTMPMSLRGTALMRLVVKVHNAALEPFAPRLPDLVVIEGLELHSKGSGGLSERCYLWWSLLNALGRTGVSVLVVSPKELKKYATGKGNATKAAVADACTRRMPQYETGGKDDLADAAWLCALGCAMLGHPLADVPALNRTVLDSLTVPGRVTTP